MLSQLDLLKVRKNMVNSNHKKVGILTFHNTLNYGASLQAYALCRVLRNIGADAEIIDYHCENISSGYETAIIRIIKNGGNIKNMLKLLLSLPYMRKRKKLFARFMNDYLSKDSFNINSIKDVDEKYESLVVGSDQVWNPELVGNDNTYFLDFADTSKRFSYAASIGKYSALDSSYTSLLEKFTMISVREEKSVVFLKNFGIDKKIYKVLDPTLLLDGNQWRKIAKSADRYNQYKRYVLVYAQGKPTYGMDLAKNIAKEYGLKVIVVHGYVHQFKKVINIRDAGMEEFLSLIEHAKYVITTSFHGMILALNLHKPFFIELNEKNIEGNERMKSILADMGLENRVLVQDQDLSAYRDIDYRDVEIKLNLMRKKSYDFIQHIID